MKKCLSILGMLGMGSLFADGAASGGGNPWQMFIMIGVAILFFYFIILRPERKRRKALEQKRSSLQKGDQVTAMGIIGTIVRIKDNSVILQIDGAKMEVLKAGVSEVKAASEDGKVEELAS